LVGILAIAFSGHAHAATIATSGGGLILIGQGRTGPGVTVQANLATAPGSTPLALDQLGGIHQISNINDGLYGNNESWIGAGATGTSGPFAGVAFTSSQAINRIAFGRDSFGSFNDRSLGTYTVQFRNDGSTADNAGWSTIGTVSYGGAQNPPAFNSGNRHEFAFNSVNATAVRLINPNTGIAIDELEVYAGSSAAPAPLSLVATGGSFGANNIALASTTSIAFAQDVIVGFPAHTIGHLNDGTYGNNNSWLGSNNPAISSFAGINLQGVFTIDTVAFGRDNIGTHSDRDEGAYTIQVTSVANPNAATADSAWRSVGIVGYNNSSITTALRNQYSFAPVAGVTGVRVITSSGSIAIDELEITGTGQRTFTLVSTGVHSQTNVVPLNLGSTSVGSVAFAKDVLFGGANASHQINNINDGLYGNSESWIGDSLNSFIGIKLARQAFVTSVAWGRDNGGTEIPPFAPSLAFTDRSLGLYTLQYTGVANPNALTLDSDWITIGQLDYAALFAAGQGSTRHEWAFDGVFATGFRLITPGNGVGSGAAIDEFEIFGAFIPEPATMSLLAMGVLALGRRRRDVTVMTA